jgi:Tol biopolymer transport system component
MMNRIGRIFYFLAITTVAFLPVSCGGGGSDPTPTSTPPLPTPTPTPSPSPTPNPSPRPTSSPPPQIAHGKIVFVSNRDGNDEIYIMNNSGTEQKRLTYDNARGSKPVFTPDGSKILFVNDAILYTMDIDGENQKPINNNIISYNPSFSYDGKKIAFNCHIDGFNNGVICIMNADGTNYVRLTGDGLSNTSGDDFPSFSPDGSKIVFNSSRNNRYDMYQMNVDGTGLARLTNTTTTYDYYPSFSPDGNKILFCSHRDVNFGIYIMNADGTEQKRLTSNTTDDREPTFSPDGSKIVFSRYQGSNDSIYVMNADGTNQTRLTNNPASDFSPSWSPN